jgi:thiol:disulfide interchange protein
MQAGRHARTRQADNVKIMRAPFLRSALAAILVLSSACAVGQAQPRRPTAEVTPYAAADGFEPGASARLVLRAALPEGYHVQSNAPRDKSLIPTVLTVDAPAGVEVSEIVYPPATDLAQAGQSQPLAVFEREFSIGVTVTIPKTATPGDIAIPARLRYQTCNDQMCFAPTTASTQWKVRVVAPGARTAPLHPEMFAGVAFGHGSAPPPASEAPPSAAPAPATTVSGDGLAALDGFDVLASDGGYKPTSEFLQFVRDAESGVQQKGMFEGRGPLAILLLVLVGGLALNLTPCVLPMIPINLAVIGAGTQAGSRRRGFLLGGAYGAGMALAYGVLGVIVTLTASTFGVINSSPWFNVAIAALFVFLALAMFDVVNIDFSRFWNRLPSGQPARGTFVTSFVMGTIAAILAGACVAPVVIQVVLFASNLYAKGTTIALALPFVLGLGMAVPWPIAGAGLASLPKPGRWMIRVKQGFGVIILAMAAYYGVEAASLFRHAATPSSASAGVTKEGWHTSLADGLAAAKREGKPVLIDMWATWCKNCTVMDNTTFVDPAVNAALERFVKIRFQAEDPEAEPAASVMRRFSSVGLPTYVILKPR